jgi:hypothetical protein
MIALDELVVALLDSVPIDAGGVDDGVRVEIDEVAMTLPVEVRFAAHRGLEASAPRGRFATGFDSPHHLLTLAFTTGSAAS